MLKEREKLERKLEIVCMNIATNSADCNKIYDHAKEHFNLPRGLVSDMICFRVSLTEMSEFILFCLTKSIYEVVKSGPRVENYYTKQEIKTYSTSKYKVDTLKFPMRLKMIQIESDQWVGHIDIKFLMKLRAAQIINYNENAQRMMQRIVRGDTETYKIALNHSAINSIKESFENSSFIPNTITFNISEEMADFYYDKKNCELVINFLEYFDIIDGYHRYIAACKTSDKNKNFNYNLELRVVNFSDEKAKKFIYQEDQKTKMKKIDSRSLNMDDASNIVTERINSNSQSNLHGLIKRNDGLINFADLSLLINHFYFKSISQKHNKNVLIISVTKELMNKFNHLIEYDSRYLIEKYSFKDLLIIMYVFKNIDEEFGDRVGEIAAKVVSKKDNMDNKKYKSRVISKSFLEEIEQIYKEVLENV